MARRRNRVLLGVASALGLALMFTGCTAGGQFDPTTLLDNDMFANKTKLQGQREPVFPNGVPGTSAGIPPDLTKGYQPPPDQTADSAAGAADGAEPPTGAGKPTALTTEEEPAGKRKPRPKLARAHPVRRRTEISVHPASQPPAPKQQAEAPSQSAWPTPQAGTVQAAPPPSAAVWPTPGRGQQQAAQPSQPVWPTPSGTPSQ